MLKLRVDTTNGEPLYRWKQSSESTLETPLISQMLIDKLSGKSTGLEKQWCGVESHLGHLTFSLKVSHLSWWCCIALPSLIHLNLYTLSLEIGVIDGLITLAIPCMLSWSSLFIRWYGDTCFGLYCLIQPTTVELPEKRWCGFESHLGQLTFSLKRRESEPSQLVLYYLALFDVSQLYEHVLKLSGFTRSYSSASPLNDTYPSKT